MSTWDLVKDLPLRIDGYGLEGRRANVSSGFERQTTLIEVIGSGHSGTGEDVVYDGEDHDAFQSAGVPADLPTGEMTLGNYCETIASLDLFPQEPVRDVSRLYRRWAFDSAALDLALRQNGLSLSEQLGRPIEPMSFVVSIRLGDPASLAPLQSRLAIAADLHFKLDPTADWDDELLAALAATGAVESVDFKALYTGTEVDQLGDASLYRRVVEALPEALIEDPGLSDPEVDAFLVPHRDRITWDAPIHGIPDIESLPFKPRMVNVKPSRLGGLRSLLDTYDYCSTNGIGCYGGGQFELGPGRTQNQLLAALFHPSAPNDLAPTGWNEPDPKPPLSAGPLRISPSSIGFAVDRVD